MRINNHLVIDNREVSYHYSRSPGPGGQNVNKVATKATLRFDVDASKSLTTQQKARIRRALATRITSEGVLHLSASAARTQSANRRAVTERFVELLAGALRPVKVRRKTRPSAASRERRLADKSRRSRIKHDRAVRFNDSDG
jgi:ribosome-associated protein